MPTIMLLSASVGWADVARVLATAAALSAPLIIAYLSRGSRKAINELGQKDTVLFPVWPFVYALGALLVAFGVFVFGFGIFATKNALQVAVACTGGIGIVALGTFTDRCAKIFTQL